MRNNRFLLVFLISSMLLLATGFAKLVLVSQATDYSVWRYHKVLTVTNSTALPVGYQLNFTVWKGVGTDYAGNFYLNNHASDNLYDLRFVDGNGILLDMWNQTAITGETHVHVWLELASSLVVVMYYGNEYASSEWDGAAAVFERVISSGVTLALPLDEGSGSTVYDYSGNENDGAVTGATWVSTGKFGEALSFDGDGDYVENLTATALPVGANDPFTLIVWVKLPLAEADGAVCFGFGNEDDGDQRALIRYNGVVYFWCISDKQSSDDFAVGVHALVVARSDGTFDLLQNDTSIYSGAVPAFPAGAQKYAVGRNIGGNQGWQNSFNATYSGIYLFDSALSNAEISDFYDYYPQVFGNHLGNIFLREWVTGVSTSSNSETDTQSTEVTTQQDVNWMAFIVLLAFAFLNVVLMLVPRFYVLNFVVGALTLATAAATVNDSTLPIQPYFSLIVALLSVLGILRAANLLRNQ